MFSDHGSYTNQNNIWQLPQPNHLLLDQNLQHNQNNYINLTQPSRHNQNNFLQLPQPNQNLHSGQNNKAHYQSNHTPAATRQPIRIRKPLATAGRSQSSNNLLPTSQENKDSKILNTEELNRLYLQMLHQRRHGMVEAVIPDIRHERQKRAKSKTPKTPSPVPALPEVILEEESANNTVIHESKSATENARKPEHLPFRRRGPLMRWTSAFRVVSAMNRFRYFAKRHHSVGTGSRGSTSISGSNESTPTRVGPPNVTNTEQEANTIDPVYLALKQATAKYGVGVTGAGSRVAGGRRGSHCVGMAAVPSDSATPSPRNLSQVSLLDSGTYSGSELCGSSSRLPATGSTPHLNVLTAQQLGTIKGVAPESRPPKLTTKMKSLSLDCAEMPPMVQQHLGMRQQYRAKAPPMRTARGAYGAYGDSFDHFELRSTSPPSRVSPAARRVQPRRLPPVPVSAQKQSKVVAQQQLHIVTHEYHSGADCTLHPGDRLVVMDNGDPDWKHGFKVNDRQEQLLTFPSSCVAGYRADEQPMRLVQTCNLADQKLRLYRDQIVFVQPNSLREDGHVMVRNEHDKVAHCPLQFLMLV